MGKKEDGEISSKPPLSGRVPLVHFGLLHMLKEENDTIVPSSFKMQNGVGDKEIPIYFSLNYSTCV